MIADDRQAPIGDVSLQVVDAPYNAEIDGAAVIRRGGQEIILLQSEAEDLAVELMRAYGLSWWPEPQDDAP